MGRLFGRRPDRTDEIARQLGSLLEAGEQVLAGVHVQRPGTNASALAEFTVVQVVIALGLGLLFGWLRVITDSLAAPVVLHALVNGINLIA